MDRRGGESRADGEEGHLQVTGRKKPERKLGIYSKHSKSLLFIVSH